MSERRILTSGIRALGVLFFVRGLDVSFTYTAIFFTSASASPVMFVFVLVRILVALGLIRYAPRIASRLVDDTSRTDTPLQEDPIWNRWLFSIAIVYAVITTWPQSFFNNLRGLVASPRFNENGYSDTIGFLLMLGIELSLLGVFILFVRRNPRLLMGRGTYDAR